MEKEFWNRLAKDNPYGVSFLPNSVRLWARRAGIEPEKAEELLKPHMFQMGELWYCRQMLADEQQWQQVGLVANKLLEKFGFFSAGAFLQAVQDLLPKVRNAAEAAVVLTNRSYNVVVYEGRNFCLSDDPAASAQDPAEDISSDMQPDEQLDLLLQKTGERLYKLLQESGELCLENLVAADFANLQLEDLELIRDKFLPLVYSQQKDYFTFWSLAEDFDLPEDFPERITNIIDLLIRLRRSLGISNLSYALDILYNEDFRREYGLDNDKIFLDQCLRAYKDPKKLRPDFARKVLKYRSSAIAQTGQTDNSSTSMRKRGPDTTFAMLGIPVGATLYYRKDTSITCTVFDQGSRVKYGDEVLYISTLSCRLSNRISGKFDDFLYEGENLWQRRVRLLNNNDYGKVNSNEKSDNYYTEDIELTDNKSEVEETKNNNIESEELINNKTEIEKLGNDNSEVEEFDKNKIEEKNDNFNLNIDNSSKDKNNNDYEKSEFSEFVSKIEQILENIESRKYNIIDKMARDRNGNLIYGIKNKPLKLNTWKSYLKSALHPKLEEWLNRFEQGEDFDDLSRGTKYSPFTIRLIFLSYRVCKKALVENEF